MNYEIEEQNEDEDTYVPDYEFPEEIIKQFYVDNDEMLQAFIDYQKVRKAAIDAGQEEPEIPRYLAECIMKIANRLAYRFNFINYSYRDEMVLDGIATCIRGFNTFDPNRSKYIFSYFTTGCWRAFIRRISLEAKQSYTKAACIYELDVDSIVTQAQDSGEYDAEFVSYMKEAQDFKMKVATPKPPKPAKVVPKNFVDLDFDGEEDDGV